MIRHLGGLSIQRFAGESFELKWESGHTQVLTVISVTDDKVVMEDSFGSVLRIPLGGYVHLSDTEGVTATITLEWTEASNAGLRVSAPRTVRVLRCELIGGE